MILIFCKALPLSTHEFFITYFHVLSVIRGRSSAKNIGQWLLQLANDSGGRESRKELAHGVHNPRTTGSISKVCKWRERLGIKGINGWELAKYIIYGSHRVPSCLPWPYGEAAAAHVGAADHGSSQRLEPLAVSGSHSIPYHGPPCTCEGSPGNCLCPAGRSGGYKDWWYQRLEMKAGSCMKKHNCGQYD